MQANAMGRAMQANAMGRVDCSKRPPPPADRRTPRGRLQARTKTCAATRGGLAGAKRRSNQIRIRRAGTGERLRQMSTACCPSRTRGASVFTATGTLRVARSFGRLATAGERRPTIRSTARSAVPESVLTIGRWRRLRLQVVNRQAQAQPLPREAFNVREASIGMYRGLIPCIIAIAPNVDKPCGKLRAAGTVSLCHIAAIRCGLIRETAPASRTRGR
jgi:hypothetical protein